MYVYVCTYMYGYVMCVWCSVVSKGPVPPHRSPLPPGNKILKSLVYVCPPPNFPLSPFPLVSLSMYVYKIGEFFFSLIPRFPSAGRVKGRGWWGGGEGHVVGTCLPKKRKERKKKVRKMAQGEKRVKKNFLKFFFSFFFHARPFFFFYKKCIYKNKQTKQANLSGMPK